MPPKMLVQRSSKDIGGLAPQAMATLSSRIVGPMYHDRSGLRHPFSIYTVSIVNVLDAAERFLAHLDQAAGSDLTSNDLPVDWDDDLLNALQGLLYAIMEHFDDCENILKGFLPPRAKHSKSPAWKAYASAIDSYRTHIGKVVNHIKHLQGRLRSIALYDKDEPHLGYFVEGPTEVGGLGPSPKIHKGGNTSFSYARDMRLHFHGLYFIAQQLSNAIGSLVNVNEQDREYPLVDDRRFVKFAKRIRDLPMVVFPDEITADFPFVSLVSPEPQTYELTTCMKRYPRGLRTVSSPFNVVTFYETDGVTRAFRMPYSK